MAVWNRGGGFCGVLGSKSAVDLLLLLWLLTFFFLLTLFCRAVGLILILLFPDRGTDLRGDGRLNEEVIENVRRRLAGKTETPRSLVRSGYFLHAWRLLQCRHGNLLMVALRGLGARPAVGEIETGPQEAEVGGGDSGAVISLSRVRKNREAGRTTSSPVLTGR